MADYTGLIRVGVEGLGEINRLNTALQRASSLLSNLENAQVVTGQIGEGAARNVQTAAQRRAQAGRRLRDANRTVENVAQRRDPGTGRFVAGGPNTTARRLAGQQLQLARREVRESERFLREQTDNQQVVFRANRRYARAIDRTTNVLANTQGRTQEQQVRNQRVMQRIGEGSRGNYLTNLFQGRQREFTRGGAGASLSSELQAQARNVRAAWDIATAGGQENLRLMQRLATEMAGLTRQQNELNRGRSGRSVAFEAGRRGQERITDLSRMPGADPARIRRLRSQATNVIATSNLGDIAGSRDASRRLNTSIGRYQRELDRAAQELSTRQRAGTRNLNVQSSWGKALSSMSDIGADIQSAQRSKGSNVRSSWQKALAQMEEIGLDLQRASKQRFSQKLKQEEKRQADLGIGINAPARIGGPTRRVSAIPMGGGADSGIVPRALPDQNLLQRRIALSGQRQPTRLDDLQAAAQKLAAEETKRAAGSVGRFAAALEHEERRLASLGIGAPTRVGGTSNRSRAGAIPMGGQGGRPGMFDQYTSPAGPGSPIGIAEFKRIQREQKQQSQQKGFFQGNTRKAVGEGLIGGAFPLLFGQGLGASVGGATGGALGGAIGGSFGFGLSLAGTAIGQAVDTTAQNLIELADAIRSPSKALDALEKSGLASGRSLEGTRFYVDQLTAVGRAYDAQTLVLQEVQKRLGPDGVRNLNALSNEQERLQGQWAVIAGTIQSQLLPALVGFTAGINDVIAAAAQIGNLPGVKEAVSARNALNKNPVTRAVLGALSPLEAAGQLFERSQGRGRAIAATSAGNRQAQTPQERFDAGTAQISESRKLADQIQSAYREAFSLQRQAYDLQRDGAMLNRDIADYSYKKEREIFDLRQQAAEKAIDNRRASTQNRIEGSDLNARQVFSAAVGFEQQLLTNVRESVRARKEGEADVEQSRKKLELAMAKLNRDVEDYKRTNAREIEDIEQRKLSYARSVEDYKMKVADYVLQRSRESADLMRQAMVLPGTPATPGGGAPGTTGAPMVNTASFMTGAGSAMPAGGVVARTGATGVGTGPHLDVRWADGRPITSADANRFIRVAGKVPSSFRVTSGYGPRLAPTAGASSFHKGIDFGTPAGTPVSLTGGARLVGSMTEAQSGGGGIVGIIDTPMGRMKLLHLEKVLTGNAQGQAAAQISNIQQPKFNPVPVGATPSAARLNTANTAARLELVGGEKEAQRILEEQNKLKQKGIELGQIEQILQGNQLPQLKQQGDVLQQQIEARQKILDLSDNAASVADIEAESQTRLAQIERDRANALAKAQKQYGKDPAVAKQINNLADKAVSVAKGEEQQRRVNLDLNNKLQNQERSRSAILQLQETLATGKAQAAALERGELEATNVELLKASDLYRFASDAEKAKLVTLTAQTEELSKQNEFRKQVNDIRQDARFTGAGLRAGLIGAPARAYEQGLKTFEGDKGKAMTLANETKLLENQRLVWGNLEKDITSVSDAISGALTNGLVDIVSGAREIQDVGRDMLNSIAGSFADSAQQQLGNLIQRQLGGLLGGAQGPLVKMLGAGGEVVGPQALGNASVFAAGEVTAFGVALQVVAAQMAMFNVQSGLGSTLSGGLSSAFSGGGSALLGGLGSLFSGSGPALSSGLGSALSSVPTNLFSKALTSTIPFGGFLAQGGDTKPGNGYIIGEKGPEFFFPGMSGKVVPRSDMEKAAALRQGGTQSDPLELDYTVTVQQGERFVSEEQMRRNNASILKQAQARTYAGMRNNNDVRSFVGI